MRRTNLFYAPTNESKFVTFSNYTEAMTGNHLSVDTKMFPSKFLCLNLPIVQSSSDDGLVENPDEIDTTGQTGDSSEQLTINSLYDILVGYYENKLAFLRDKIGTDETHTVEESIQPLNYLLEKLDPKYITYVGEISEQNYNGTYSDTICLIEGTALPHKVEWVNSATDNLKTIPYNVNADYLYGWSSDDEYNGPQQYENSHPQFDKTSDTDNVYFVTNEHIGISYDAADESISEIKFNCVIPLFDIVNVNHLNNRSTIEEENKITFENPDGAIINQPMGIWFTPECEPIVLKRDPNTGYMPSWSLVLGSQFKPFPNSTFAVQDKNDIIPEHNTFAELLAKQTELTNTFTKIITQFNNLTNEVNSIKGMLNSLGTLYHIDELKLALEEFKASTNYKIKNIEKSIAENVWHSNE